MPHYYMLAPGVINGVIMAGQREQSIRTARESVALIHRCAESFSLLALDFFSNFFRYFLASVSTHSCSCHVFQHNATPQVKPKHE